MIHPHFISEEELHAFIDGELEPARAESVAAAAAVDEVLAARIAAYRADKDRIARVYGPLIHKPLPQAWLRRLDAARGPSPLPRRAAMAVAASAALVVAGISAYRLFGLPKDEILEEAVAAYDGALLSAGTAGPERADETLASALGLGVKTPDLKRMGFVLTGLSVYAGTPGGAAVKLDYRDQANRPFAVYVRKSLGTARFEMTRRGAVRICVWQDDAVGTVMLGEMQAGEMLRLASLAYRGLNDG
jgi:anti-sigma factor RsiW